MKNSARDTTVRVLTVGMVNMDRIVLSRVAEPGKPVFRTRPTIERPGSGHPANVALDLVKLGFDSKQVGVVACVGLDTSGDAAMGVLTKAGVQHFLQRVEVSTGENIIFVDEGVDRRFHIYPGANLKLASSFVSQALRTAQPEILSIRPGYSGIDDDAASLMESAQAQGAYVLLDVIKPHMREWSYFRSALPYVNALHCNDLEAMGMTGAETPERAVDALLDFGVGLVFLTMGERGALIATKEFRITQGAFRIEVVDPTGCGDAFCSGICMYLLEQGVRNQYEKHELQTMLLRGQATGAAAATAAGCTEGVSQETVEKLLVEQGRTVLENS